MTPDTLTVRETAARLGRSTWYVDQLIADGLLDARRRGPRGRRYVTTASLDAWIAGGSPNPAAAVKVYEIPGVVAPRGRAA